MKNNIFLGLLSKIVSFFVVLCVILSFSCAPAPKKVETVPVKNQYIFYPPLPNKPKLQYLTTISSSKDIKPEKGSFFKFVVGEDEEKPIEIKKPYGVELHNGCIYVCDMSAGAVDKLNLKTGEFSFLGLTGPGKLGRPVNIKIDKKNNLIYVADNGRKQVVVFDEAGNYVKAYGTTNQFVPVDVDISENKLFVCDIKGHQVHVLDKTTGATIYKIGKPGSKEGELFHPTNICYHDGKIFVSDTTNFRIQIFDEKGNYVSTFGHIGDRPGSFSRNKGIDIDKHGNIYVVDAAFENVQIFDKDFNLLLFFLKSGADKDNINLPAGIVIDYDNIEYFKKYLSPNFKPEYLLLVTSQFGLNKVNVYAFGNYN